VPDAATDFEGHDQPDDVAPPHRNAPQPDPACLYGLIGEIARAGSDGTETNAFAIAANFMAYLSCAVGRGVYLPIGNTRHHARLFCLHIGRSGRGRKGDAVSLVLRIDQAIRAIDESFVPQIHRGGLSSREGLVALMHDGYRQGRHDVPAIEDKRLWVVESEFANELHQGRRDGNTLSAALRDCWDGIDLKPATKSNRLYASHPHVCLSGAISPSELTGLMSARELTNGFGNRFLMIWAERTRMLPFPKETPLTTVEQLARETLEVLAFVRSDRYEERDHLRMELSPQAQWRYAQLYRGVLNDDLGDGTVGALLERRAPMLLRLAMLLALTDLQTRIDAPHIDAAMGWIRHATASVRHVFVSAAEDAKQAQILELSNRVLAFLRVRGQATRSQISADCFKGKVPKTMIDASLEHLLVVIGVRHDVDVADLLVPAHLAGGVVGLVRGPAVGTQVDDVHALPPLVGHARLIPTTSTHAFTCFDPLTSHGHHHKTHQHIQIMLWTDSRAHLILSVTIPTSHR
jgi:putative DNA primase/helicase